MHFRYLVTSAEWSSDDAQLTVTAVARTKAELH